MTVFDPDRDAQLVARAITAFRRTPEFRADPDPTKSGLVEGPNGLLFVELKNTGGASLAFYRILTTQGGTLRLKREKQGLPLAFNEDARRA
jgi:hypothetical protein